VARRSSAPRAFSGQLQRAIAYCRVSSEEQADRGTIELQVGSIRAWCAAQGVELVEVFLDEGISGTVMFSERPAAQAIAQQLPSLIALGVTHVLIYKWDRVGRDPVAFWSAVHVLERVGGLRIKSITETADTSTPESILMLSVHSGVSSYERSKIIERSVTAMNQHARRGTWLGGLPPFGYRLDGEGRERVLVTDERPIPGTSAECGLTPAVVVQQIFTWAAQGSSLLQLCDRLNALGVPPSARKGAARAAGWQAQRVRLLLRNPVYYGTREWGHFREGSLRPQEVIQCAVPALVTLEQWQAAQEAIARRRRFAARNTRRDYPLRGLLRCVRCGYSMTGRTHSDLRYYACWGTYARSRPGIPACNQPYANAEALEAQVWERVAWLLRDPETAALQLLATQEATGDRQAEVLAGTLQQRLAGVAAARQRVITLHRDNLMTRAELEVQLSELHQHEERWRGQLAQLAPSTPSRYLHSLRQPDTLGYLAELGLGLEHLTPARRRAILELLVDHITVTIEGRQRSRVVSIDIRWRL
jgi:site-specific DNA recombinase